MNVVALIGQQSTDQALIRAVFEILPAAPALVALAQFTYQSGSLFGPAAGPGPVVFRMEAGQLTFQAEGPLTFVASLSTASVAQRTIEPGTSFDIRPGNQLLVPGNTTHQARSSGAVTAAMMGLAIFPQVPPQQFPPGITFQPLVMGMASAIPQSPAEVSLDRVHCGRGAVLDLAYSGPTLYHLKDGRMSALLRGGEAQVARAQASGPFNPPQQMSIGQPIELGPGDGLFAQQNAAIVLRNTNLGTATHVRGTILPSLAEARKRIAARYFYEIWNGGDLSQLADLVAMTYVNRTPLRGQSPGRDGLRQFVAQWRTAFPDTSVSVDQRIASGQKIAIRWTARGTHHRRFLGLAPTHKAIEVSGITVFRIDNDLICESWDYWDQATMLQQLGAVKWPGPV